MIKFNKTYCYNEKPGITARFALKYPGFYLEISIEISK